MLGRRSECAVFDGLLEAARGGRSGVLMVRGEAGIGKTALLQYAIDSASDLQVVRAVGVESEMELAFAALHQLCTPMLDRVERLPDPQRDALGTTFGLTAGPPPDRFLVGLAVLSLVSEAAAERPLLCVVDDVQWLDQASAKVLGFVARRLLAESVVLLLAERKTTQEFIGLPELVVQGLSDGDARELLASVVPGPLDETVRERIVAESRGNPLALMELPRELATAELAGGFGLPDTGSLSGRIEENFRTRLDALPVDSQRLLLVAAAEPTGDPALLWRAATRLGIGDEALGPAESAGLLEVGARARFRHPLVRSAVYRAGSPEQRREAHRTLAELTDAGRDPDRRAWHLAAAAPGPDEEVAAELERSAGRAQARGGMAAAAAFLQRAAELTAEPRRRSERALAAGQASLDAGGLEAAAELLAMAMAGPLDELQQARAGLLRGQIAFASGGGSDAPGLLARAAKQLEPLDAALARQTYLDAWVAARFAGRLAAAGDLREVSRGARSAPPPAGMPEPSDELLNGLAVLVTDGRAAAAPLLRRAAQAFAEDEITVEDSLRWGFLAVLAARAVWDEERWHTIAARQLRFCREAGSLAQMVISVNALGILATWRGDFAAAASLVAEAEAVAAATGTRFTPFAGLMLAGFRGAEAEAVRLIEAVSTAARAAGQGLAVQFSQWVAAVLYNGLGRYETALAEARQASEQAPELQESIWALPELIEAASRTGQTQLAARALDRLAEATSIGETDWGQGIYARSRALLSDGEDAEGWYRQAADRLSRTRLRPELARAHLLYGEWLRRERRRVDAREQLRTAHEMFTAMGVESFAERAERELLATGERVRKRALETGEPLTSQEVQVARLARDGLSNPEIGARLFISPRTAEYHLHKVFSKLGISSRHELRRVLSTDATAAVAV